MTTMTFTVREMAILQAALAAHQADRKQQSDEAEAAGDMKGAAFFQRQEFDAEDLYRRVFYACDVGAEERKAKTAA